MASQLGAPEQLINKAPTADLESLDPSKTDEDALGLSYDQIDDFLEGKKVESAAEQRIIEIFESTQHKRQAMIASLGLKAITKKKRLPTRANCAKQSSKYLMIKFRSITRNISMA
jgi:NH3-dependent NAD+ synthetase